MANLQELEAKRERLLRRQDEIDTQLADIDTKINEEKRIPQATYTVLVTPWNNSMYKIPAMWSYTEEWTDGEQLYPKRKRDNSRYGLRRAGVEYRMPQYSTLEAAKEAGKELSYGYWRYSVAKINRDGTIEIVYTQTKEDR